MTPSASLDNSTIQHRHRRWSVHVLVRGIRAEARKAALEEVAEIAFKHQCTSQCDFGCSVSEDDVRRWLLEETDK